MSADQPSPWLRTASRLLAAAATLDQIEGFVREAGSTEGDGLLELEERLFPNNVDAIERCLRGERVRFQDVRQPILVRRLALAAARIGLLLDGIPWCMSEEETLRWLLQKARQAQSLRLTTRVVTDCSSATDAP